MHNSRKQTVALVFGGRSSEHSVSCVTAAGVYREIDTSRYDVVLVGITQAGEFVSVTTDELLSYSLDSSPLPEVRASGDRLVFPTSTVDHTLRAVAADGSLTDVAKIDVVMAMLHGPFGEDGTVQGLCELSDLPYVGSGVLASALCMDKHTLKIVLQAAGVPVAPWRTVTAAAVTDSPEIVSEMAAELEYPVFVKPARAGSSVGVTKVAAAEQLADALTVAFAEDKTALVETSITGREVEIGVLEDTAGGELVVSDVVGEIVFSGREFYDFEAKYLGAAGADVVLPADVTAAEYAALSAAARAAFAAAGCAGYARIDFFLTETGPVLNEINTLPGFTPVSMYPRLMAESGISYRQLITTLLELAQQCVR